ncbi:MAG: copper transporter [Acidimicrobiales bacterium]
MISFRFHVVSITAVFLAIAIGVVVGSTYIDRVTVDQLRNRIDTVEHRADATRDDNGRLEDELSTTRQYVDLSSEYAVSDRLVDVPALVVAARGVDDSAIERTVVLARRAGGQVPGIVWLEPRWAAESDDDLQALADAVGGSSTDSRDALWATAWEKITDELASPPPPDEPGGPAVTSAEPSVLTKLEDAGFLSLDSLDDSSVGLADLLGTSPRMLIVTGARADEEVQPVIPVAADASVDAGLGTVVADVYVVAPEAPARAATLVDSLEGSLRDSIVIVDDADLEPGRVAAVLALDLVTDDGEVGRHYGYGDGADAVLPAWTPP